MTSLLQAYDETTYDLTITHFPLVLHAFRCIQQDNSGGMARGIKQLEKVGRWAHPMSVAEYWLTRIGERSVKEVCPALLKMPHYEDIGGSDLAAELVYLGVNDSSTIILRAAGASESEIWVIEHLFNEFFDGELTQKWQNPPKIKRGRNPFVRN